MEYLKPFCLGTQLKYIEAVIQHGSISKAAQALGCNQRTISRTLQKVRKRAASQGVAPENDMTKEAPEGFHVKGTSTLYDADGNAKLQWVKTNADRDRAVQIILDALSELTDSIPAIPEIPEPRKDSDSDLLSTYVLSDWHLGAYAWAAESGSDYDVKIAEEVLINAVADMIAASPNSEKAIFCMLGDSLHYDGLEAVTPTNHNILDADTRFQKLVHIALSVCIKTVGMLLKKHKKVIVLIAEGNHDLASTAWLHQSLYFLFRDNKRVEVDTTPFPYYAIKHGDIMIAFHHGHKTRKLKSLPELFASEPRYRKMWGDSRYCFIHTGHLHKQEMASSEHGGAVIIRHPTLSGREAYSARSGWVSWRSARSYTYHKKYGEVSSVSVVPRLESI